MNIRKEVRAKEAHKIVLTRGLNFNQIGRWALEGKKLGNAGQTNRPQNSNQQRQTRPPLPDCKTCGKKHSGVCNKANIVCYKCNQKGHYSNECIGIRESHLYATSVGSREHMARDCRTPAPVNNMLRLAGPPTVTQPRAMTFNMNMREAIQDTNVVAGTLPINSRHAKVLFDSGATKSFISKEFMRKINCETQVLDEPLVIELANQERVPVHQVCPHCRIYILGHQFSASLIPFQLGEFDVILGMDWLTDYDAKIDCKDKKVTLKSSNDVEVVFKGQKQTQKFLTIMQTKKLLRQGCEAYLAHVIDTQKTIPKLEEILVVNEFPDVFPEELPGLPPDREIEFAIDLAPGT